MPTKNWTMTAITVEATIEISTAPLTPRTWRMIMRNRPNTKINRLSVFRTPESFLSPLLRYWFNAIIEMTRPM